MAPQVGSILDRPVVGDLHFHFLLQGFTGKHLIGFAENLPQPYTPSFCHVIEVRRDSWISCIFVFSVTDGKC